MHLATVTASTSRSLSHRNGPACVEALLPLCRDLPETTKLESSCHQHAELTQVWLLKSGKHLVDQVTQMLHSAIIRTFDKALNGLPLEILAVSVWGRLVWCGLQAILMRMLSGERFWSAPVQCGE